MGQGVVTYTFGSRFDNKRWVRVSIKNLNFSFLGQVFQHFCWVTKHVDWGLHHLYLLRITEELYIRSSWSGSHFFNLSRSVHTCSSPKHLLSHSKPLPKWFFKFFQAFSSFPSLGKILISFIYIHSCFETSVLGFLKNLWFFIIDKLLLKFWDGFLLKCVLNLMHCITLA